MIAGTAQSRGLDAIPRLAGTGVRGIAGAVAMGAAAAAVVVIGPAAAVLPFVLAFAVAAFAWPRAAFWTALVFAIAVDPAPVGSTERLTLAAWELPIAVLRVMPLKMNPFEVMLAMAFAGAMLRPGAVARPSLPPLAWGVPLFLVAGLGYGVAQGGAVNLAYHEARGLIFGTLAFLVAWRTGGPQPRALARLAVASTALLGVSVVYRFAVDLRGGTAGPPKELWFGHETALFLAGGFLLGLLLTLKARKDRERLFFALYSAMMLAAVMMTGRRSGILVLGAGVLLLAILAYPKRPALLTTVAAVSVVFGAVYLDAYWDAGAGPVGEPARAIRSQVDPDARDESSDRYREIERHNIAETLKANPLFGVGFGRPFTEHEELPDLEFWPLQLYTPHDNLLWLWLKTGLFGAVALMGVAVIALKRCLVAARPSGRGPALAVEPALLAALIVMYLAYARVDLAFVTARSAAPLAVVLAIALSRAWRPAEGVSSNAVR